MNTSKIELASRSLNEQLRKTYSNWFAVGIREGPLVERDELVVYHEGTPPWIMEIWEGYPVVFHKTEQPRIGY